MTTNKQDRKVEWEKKRVQRVLDYHNNKYSTHIVIKGRTTDVYHNLKGQLNWDWVCCEIETDDEFAIEVKKLTDPKLEGRGKMIWDILEEIKDNLSNKLPGIFVLGINISPKNYYLPLRGQQNKQKFKNVLCDAIFQTAQTLKLKEERGLTPQISRQLPFALPDSFFCALQKVSDEGSALALGSGVVGFWSLQLNERELREFEKNVAKANKQLKKANVKETFLVIIEEGLRLATPYTVTDAFKRINCDSYSYINRIYYVSGEEVAEVPLPTP